MMLFYTNSAKHIASRLGIRKARFEIRRFSDGEIYVKIRENVRGRKVWVLASIISPADNILELLFLLDVLKREKAKINLLIPYFGYARQDRIFPGECFSAKVMCDLLKSFRLNKIFVIDMHSHRLDKFLNFKDIVPYESYDKIAKRFDIIVAPDRGALPKATAVSKASDKHLAWMEKFRLKKEKVEIRRINGNVRGKKALIIDDMVSTGGTIIEAAKKLLENGAVEVCALITHGVFAGDAIKNIENSRIKTLYVTNTIQQKHKSKKIITINITDFIGKIIKRTD